MGTPALEQLRHLQRMLYERAYKEAHSLVAGSSRSILNYSDKFEASLPEDFEKTTLAEILDQARRKDFLIWGDFHTLKQSQRGLLRLLRSLVERSRPTPIVLAVEMFKAKDQKVLDAFIRGEIDDETFLERTNYAKDWGFPWPNFKMILDYSIQNSIPVIAINSDGAGRDSLTARDSFAANLLLDAKNKYPSHLVVCLIGEYHLADQHLPRAIQREQARRGSFQHGNILRIVANVDRYYFKLQLDTSLKSTEYLRLKKDFYCIINSPPWMKWQSYAIWEEMRTAGETGALGVASIFDDDAFDTYTEDSFDIDYQFLGLTKHLATFLGLREKRVDLNEFNIRYSIDGDFGKDAIKIRRSEHDIDGMLERAALDGVYFATQNRTVLLTSLSINNLAEAAGQFLHSALTGFVDFGDSDAETFYRKVLKSAVGMIASKILNPRRKSPTLRDHEKFVNKLRRRRLLGHAATRRDIGKAILKHHQWMRDALHSQNARFIYPPRSIFTLDRQTHWEVSQAIGYLMGQSLYTKVMSNKVSTDRIRRLFSAKIDDFPSLWKVVTEIYELV